MKALFVVKVSVLKAELQFNRLTEFNELIGQGLTAAAPILLITGAGGAFGAVGRT